MKAIDDSFIRALVENATDSIIHVDLEGKIRFINRVIPGLEKDKVLGTNWLLYVNEDARDDLHRKFEKAISTGQPIDYEIEGDGPHGRRSTYLSRMCPMHVNAKVIGIVVIARDITEKINLEKKMHLTERLSTLGTLVAGIAHEINNPLSYTMLNVGMIQEDLEYIEKQKIKHSLNHTIEKIKKINEGLGRIKNIVKDLKTLSRSDEDVAQGPVDVHHSLDSALSMASHFFESRAKIIKEYRTVPPVMANETRLIQVFLNILVNSAHSICEGNAKKNSIHMKTYVDENRVKIMFSDTGCGIAPENLKKVFDPFFTTKPVGVGTGLGLSFCRGIMQSLGGQINIESKVHQGTTVTLSLPQAPKN